MQVDKTTISDLTIFARDDEHSILNHLNFTRTVGGREWLKFYLNKPLGSVKEIRERQQILKNILSVRKKWPMNILNGTIMVLEKFFETSVADIPQKPSAAGALIFKITYKSDYSLLEYSVGHFIEFVRGLDAITQILKNNPPLLQVMMERIEMLLRRSVVQNILASGSGKNSSAKSVIIRGNFLRRHFKNECFELIEIYSQLDAFYAMALACEKYNYTFPVFIDTGLELTAKQLYHPLLPTPVAYDISLMEEKNFLFLTGANMAGKSTFIKAVGVAVYLAHVGMGVPAESMELNVFDGLLSNIQVADNIIKGESYFFNEVQRIRKTLEKISDGRKWLILIDELFKGTNVQDAMKCSTVVIEGLLKMHNTLFILSTHLYEIGEALKRYPNIQFRYFETRVKEDELLFNYQLKDGISNDRLGYLILKREGVVDMLSKL